MTCEWCREAQAERRVHIDGVLENVALCEGCERRLARLKTGRSAIQPREWWRRILREVREKEEEEREIKRAAQEIRDMEQWEQDRRLMKRLGRYRNRDQ
jgi:acetone carboxylase gamma subunit